MFDREDVLFNVIGSVEAIKTDVIYQLSPPVARASAHHLASRECKAAEVAFLPIFIGFGESGDAHLLKPSLLLTHLIFKIGSKQLRCLTFRTNPVGLWGIRPWWVMVQAGPQLLAAFHLGLRPHLSIHRGHFLALFLTFLRALLFLIHVNPSIRLRDEAYISILFPFCPVFAMSAKTVFFFHVNCYGYGLLFRLSLMNEILYLFTHTGILSGSAHGSGAEHVRHTRVRMPRTTASVHEEQRDASTTAADGH
jgi:hypothetical protein